jgi:hypothetical protein
LLQGDGITLERVCGYYLLIRRIGSVMYTHWFDTFDRELEHLLYEQADRVLQYERGEA